jgi:hypothetical protein
MFSWLRTKGQGQPTQAWLEPIRPIRHTEQVDRVAESDRAAAEPKAQDPKAQTAASAPRR